jgi:hypothetical protein
VHPERVRALFDRVEHHREQERGEPERDRQDRGPRPSIRQEVDDEEPRGVDELRHDQRESVAPKRDGGRRHPDEREEQARQVEPAKPLGEVPPEPPEELRDADRERSDGAERERSCRDRVAGAPECLGWQEERPEDEERPAEVARGTRLPREVVEPDGRGEGEGEAARVDEEAPRRPPGANSLHPGMMRRLPDGYRR